MGKILRINLSTQKISISDVNPKDEETYIGGSGVAAALFTREVPATIEAFDPQNLLIFSVGPFCGTAVPFCGRHFVTTKSPATKLLGEASSGGFWGKELKSAGFDHVIIEGKAPTPMFISIANGQVQLKDATTLWGKGTRETETVIKQILKEENVKIASIGPAGENLVKFASIINENDRAAARCGVGAVMGSKNLKAIAVHGTEQVNVHDKAGVLEESKKIRELLKQSPMADVYRDFGTPTGIDSMSGIGDVPIKNYTESRWKELSKIGSQALIARGEIKHHGCFNCPVACTGLIKYEDRWVRWPEYETLAMLGSNLMIDNLEALIRWNVLADDLGMDTISLGGVLAMFLEAVERGKIFVNLDELGFLPDLQKRVIHQIWGVDRPVENLIHLIARRSGIGNDLAEGVRFMVEKYSLPEDLATHVRGLEVPAHEPRANNLTALDYATTPRGAYHCYMPMHLSTSMNLKKEIGLTQMVDRFAVEEAAKSVKLIQDASEAYCACGGCIFGFNFLADMTPWIASLNAITGRAYNVESWTKSGETLFNLKRLYNQKCGTGKQDDSLNSRFMTPILKGGTRKNIPPLKEMLGKYYQLRGW